MATVVAGVDLHLLHQTIARDYELGKRMMMMAEQVQEADCEHDKKIRLFSAYCPL